MTVGIDWSLLRASLGGEVMRRTEAAYQEQFACRMDVQSFISSEPN